MRPAVRLEVRPRRPASRGPGRGSASSSGTAPGSSTQSTSLPAGVSVSATRKTVAGSRCRRSTGSTCSCSAANPSSKVSAAAPRARRPCGLEPPDASSGPGPPAGCLLSHPPAASNASGWHGQRGRPARLDRVVAEDGHRRPPSPDRGVSPRRARSLVRPRRELLLRRDARPASPICRRTAAVHEHGSQRVRQLLRALRTGTTSPVAPSATTLPTSPTSVATTGRPAAMASSTDSGIASHHEGRQNTSACGELLRASPPACGCRAGSRTPSRRLEHRLGGRGPLVRRAAEQPQLVRRRLRPAARRRLDEVEDALARSQQTHVQDPGRVVRALGGDLEPLDVDAVEDQGDATLPQRRGQGVVTRGPARDDHGGRHHGEPHHQPRAGAGHVGLDVAAVRVHHDRAAREPAGQGEQPCSEHGDARRQRGVDVDDVVTAAAGPDRPGVRQGAPDVARRDGPALRGAVVGQVQEVDLVPASELTRPQVLEEGGDAASLRRPLADQQHTAHVAPLSRPEMRFACNAGHGNPARRDRPG